MTATNLDDPAVQSERIEENPLLQKLVSSQPELEALYESIGCSFALWRHVARVASKVRSCCDPDSLTAWEHEHDLQAQILLVPGGATLLQSHLEFEFLGPQWGGHCPIAQGFWNAAVRARTALLEELKGNPGQVSAVHICSILYDATRAVDPKYVQGENELKKRKLDDLLWRIEVGMNQHDESDRTQFLAWVSTEYLRTPWMQTPFLTERLARHLASEMLKPFRKGKKRSEIVLLEVAVGAAAVVILYYFGLVWVAVPLLVVALQVFWRRVRSARQEREAERAVSELNAGYFSGRILANRFERVYGLGANIPSVLPALLDLLP